MGLGQVRRKVPVLMGAYASSRHPATFPAMCAQELRRVSPMPLCAAPSPEGIMRQVRA